MIEIHSPTSVDAQPPVAWLLRALPYEKLHYFRYNVRHPAGIYGLSLTRIAQRLAAVLDGLDSVMSSYKLGMLPDNIIPLVDRYESFLYSLDEHLEDCK